MVSSPSLVLAMLYLYGVQPQRPCIVAFVLGCEPLEAECSREFDQRCQANDGPEHLSWMPNTAHLIGIGQIQPDPNPASSQGRRSVL
jgi:hypothetical protein